MSENQTVWLITWILVFISLLATLIIYIYTGDVILALIIAPPIIHWILKRKNKRADY